MGEQAEWDAEPRSTTLARVAKLAAPVVLGELGWMSMTVVDTIMVGPLGPAAIGAIGIGNSAFYTFAICGMGLLLGLDTLVSQAFGAGNRDDCDHSLMQGVYLAFAMAVPLMLLFAYMPPVFRLLGIVPEVSAPAGIFLTTLNWSTLPLLLYACFRRYLQGCGLVRPVMIVMVSANLVNWLCNYLFIQGHWGCPALGVAGSALSTDLARTYMAGALLAVIFFRERRDGRKVSSILCQPDLARLKLLLRLGFPAAAQILLEIGAFGAAGVFAGRLNPIALAAHQIALNCAAVSFMIPLGTASAAAVAVGQAVGRGQPGLARRSGFFAIAIACVFMTSSAVLFLTIPKLILIVYTQNAAVIALGTGLLAVAACFQLFDGIQAVATGALRGLGETRAAMLANLVGYWAMGLPLGYLLCFRYGFGVNGLWWGLTSALIAIALSLLVVWHRHSFPRLESLTKV